jgi:hypothetical protein
MTKELKAQTVIVAVLAMLLMPALAYMFRVPVGLALLTILIGFCPCISSECVNCNCDRCVFRVLIAGIALLAGVSLLFYLTLRRKSFR